MTAHTTLPTTLPVAKTSVIDYRNEGFTGSIPTEFGLLTELTRLNLADNTLTGSIPTELGMNTVLTRACSSMKTRSRRRSQPSSAS